MDDEAGMVFEDEVILEKQRTLLQYLVKKIGANMLKGQSIMSISLPVSIFESRSFLQKQADDFGYVPFMLDHAYQEVLVYHAENNFTEESMHELAIKRLKWVVTWVINTLHLEPQMYKPFNPILGETFQCKLGDYDLYLEQTSHHPPILHFQMEFPGKTDTYPTLEGFYKYEASTGPRSMSVDKKGEARILFKDTNQEIFCTFPCGEF